VLDRTTTIRASVNEVERTLLTSTLLVVIVVFLFLRNLRSTFIPGIAMPVSLIGTFGVMYLFGYSIDNLSLMALTIATGFVVDDAIVVMENITRHVEAGMKPMAAALKGAEEIGSTVFTISISLVAVFIPLLLMGGIVGRLFREFAVTLSAAIIVSMIVSLTLTPMMCAYLLRHSKEEKHGRFYRLSESTFDRLLAFYRRSLHWVLAHPRLTLSALLCTVALNVALVIVIPKGFFPQQDTGLLGGGVRGRQDTSFGVMEDSIRRIEAVVNADPAVANVIGFTGGGATNTGNVFTSLKPLNQRKVSAAQVINRLRPKLNRLPVASVYMQANQDLRIGGRSSNAMYQYTMESDNVQDLIKWGPILVEQMAKLPGFQDVNSDQQNGGLDEMLNYDRVTAARFGLTTQQLDSALYGAFGQAEVSVIYKPLNYYYVVLEVAPQFSQGPEGLKYLYLPTAGGGAIPMSAVATGYPTTTALAINHTGLFPSVTASFNLAPNVSLSEATASIDRMQARLGAPSSIRGFFAGTLQAYQQSLRTEPILVLTALLSVFIVLGVLYESLVHPLTIISTLPSAGVGALIALVLFKTDLSIIAMIGIILLIGIVKKNAIMMIDFALEAERAHGKSPLDAIHEACLLRFRPIMMTTMAALFGGLPLAVGFGAGSELRRPMGVAIVGGLLVSQALTLYTTPVIYLYLERMRQRLTRRRSRPPEATTAPAESSTGNR
jgi:multidrug efflux pump